MKNNTINYLFGFLKSKGILAVSGGLLLVSCGSQIGGYSETDGAYYDPNKDTIPQGIVMNDGNQMGDFYEYEKDTIGIIEQNAQTQKMQKEKYNNWGKTNNSTSDWGTYAGSQTNYYGGGYGWGYPYYGGMYGGYGFGINSYFGYGWNPRISIGFSWGSPWSYYGYDPYWGYGGYNSWGYGYNPYWGYGYNPYWGYGGYYSPYYYGRGYNNLYYGYGRNYNYRRSGADSVYRGNSMNNGGNFNRSSGTNRGYDQARSSNGGFRNSGYGRPGNSDSNWGNRTQQPQQNNTWRNDNGGFQRQNNNGGFRSGGFGNGNSSSGGGFRSSGGGHSGGGGFRTGGR